MRSVILLVTAMLMGMGSLAALGYTSAYVETERIIEQLNALEELEQEFNKTEESARMDISFSPALARAGSYTRAQDLTLATPSLDPISDATSRLIYSLMDMILLRFKQQLFVSFVSQWKDEMLSSEYQYLFPHLAKLLTSIDSGNFLSNFELWKASIDMDLREAPLGMMNFTLKLLEETRNMSPAESSALTELTNLMSDIYAFRSVSNLNEFILLSTTSGTPRSEMVKLIGIVAKNMLDEDGKFVLHDLRTRITDPHWLGIYLGLVQRDIAEITINNDSFRLTQENFAVYLETCSSVVDFFGALHDQAGQEAVSQANNEEHVKLYLGTGDKLIAQLSRLARSASDDWDDYYRTYTRYRFKLIEVTHQVDNRQYKSVLNTLITTSVDLAQEHDYIPMSYSRFLNLISTIALTSEEQEIGYRDIIDAVLEPVGSYAYKRQSDFCVDLNAYPGLGGGAEALALTTQDIRGVAGLACPLGLEVNWGGNFSGIRGVFLSALDLGAVASYRFAKGDSLDSSSPQIGWKQLVSPGLYLLLQNQKNPITLGLGMQLTPALRKISENGTKVSKNALRFGAFVSMDIPLFTFYIHHKWQTNHRLRAAHERSRSQD